MESRRSSKRLLSCQPRATIHEATARVCRDPPHQLVRIHRVCSLTSRSGTSLTTVPEYFTQTDSGSGRVAVGSEKARLRGRGSPLPRSIAVSVIARSEGGRAIDREDALLTQITASQRPLFAYIRTLIGPGSDVDDVLQEVNLILWRKRDEFDGRGRFLTWACHIAYLQVLAHCKKRRRESILYRDEGVLDNIAGCLTEEVEHLRRPDRGGSRARVLAKLPPAQRRVILRRGVTKATRLGPRLSWPASSAARSAR